MFDLPQLSQSLFLLIMVILQIADAWTTYDGMRLGAQEANPIANRLMKAIGLREALWVIKLAVIACIVIYPVTNPYVQWANIVAFAAISINNYRIIRKLRARK